MTQIDGYQNWRDVELVNLTKLIQRRFEYLQNPKNCSSARKLLCKHRNECGFSCNADHLLCCLVLAYGTDRTLVLQPKNYIYYEGGFEQVFQPFSRTCVDDSLANVPQWPG